MQIISRKQAIELGERHYFTGKPCKNGHVEKRLVCNCACVICSRIKSYERSKIESVKIQNKINKQKESYKEKQKEYNKTDKAKELRKKRYRDSKNYQKKKEYREKNKEAHKKYMNEYYNKNREKLIADQKTRASSNEYKEKRKEYIRNWQKEFRNTKNGKIICLMRKLISRIVLNKTERTENALGYSKKEFMAHIERQFLKGMNWDNFGEWHIDHIVPVSFFIKTKIDDPKIINALSNLRPIWAKDNLSKHSKITHLV